MKVLLAHNYYQSSAPSGEDVVFNNEYELLNGNGVDVIKFERFNDDIDDSTLYSKLKVAHQGAWSRSSYREIDQLIKKNKPDIAHFHNTFPLITPSAYAACKDNGVPVVQTLHNYRLFCANGQLLRDNKPCELCINGALHNAFKHKCYRNSRLATSAMLWIL
ncbi:MAG: glycosyltransferase, partial [Gammaproteobacteria bacterium]|nr:glycosyltransferase [Gammaproteobacteria bacterium]